MTMSFSHLSKNIYPKELDLKVKRQGKYASFLDLDIKIEDCPLPRETPGES